MSDSQLEYLEAKRKKLEDGNNRSYNELRQETHGEFSMDTGDLRRELFMTFLVKWGIVSQEQALEFEIKFHEKVEEALNTQWEALREARKARGLKVVKQDKRLLGPNGRPLS
jgi:hypothetical protein